ncbi:MAG: V-type ATPase subunit [Candidatus Micrarchaeota archaeon]
MKLPGLPFNPLRNRALIYGYSNARVKAMKTFLIPQGQMEEMVDVGELGAVTGILERTNYKEDLVVLSLRYSGADLIELALGRNFARTCRKLIRIAPGDATSTLLGILERWDVHNLKTIILAKGLGYPEEQITPFLVPAGGLGEAELKKILKKDAGELAEYLKRTKYAPVAEAFEEHAEDVRNKNLAPILSALDNVYFRALPGKITAKDAEMATILSLVRAEVDMKNIMSILRAKKENLGDEAIGKLMIEGGNLGANELRKLIEAKTIPDMIARLRRAYNLNAALEKYNADNSLTHFEIDLENRIAEKGIKALRRSILSIGAIVGFLYLKEAEVKNIRKIVRAKEFRIPNEKLKEMLITVGG